MDKHLIVHLIIIILILYVVYKVSGLSEGLCVDMNDRQMVVSSEPYSDYVNNNMALTNTTTIGAAPLGNPKYWIPGTSPITNGQWALYESPLTLDQVDHYDPRNAAAMAAAKSVPIYNGEPPALPPQCTRV